jgi:hypothetical protein
VDRVQQRHELDATVNSPPGDEAVAELIPGESADVGPQSVLKIAPRKTHFEASADAQYFYTDNLFLADRNNQNLSADVLVSTVQAALAPTPYPLGGGQFSPRLGYRHQWFNFGLANDETLEVFDFKTKSFRTVDLDEFDFNAQTLFVDGRWKCNNWIFGMGFNFQRLLDSDEYDEFYHESAPQWEFRRIIPICPDSSLAIGYEGDYRFTDSDLPPLGVARDFNDRTDHSLVVNYAFSICPQTVLQPYYRLQYTHFTQGEERDDWLNSFGIAIHCAITRRVSLRAFFGYDMLRTNSQLAQDYDRLDAGGGVNFTIRF